MAPLSILPSNRTGGKIRPIGCYPIHTFAKEIKTRPIIDCWVTYLNLHERGYPTSKQPIVAIRPLAAGRILNDQTLISLLQKEEFFAQYTGLEMAIVSTIESVRDILMTR